MEDVWLCVGISNDKMERERGGFFWHEDSVEYLRKEERRNGDSKPKDY